MTMLTMRRRPAMRGLFDLGSAMTPEELTDRNATPPLLNRILGTTICPTMDCTLSETVDANGVVIAWGRPSCETFWRPDRLRSYVALAGLGTAIYYGYRYFKGRR